MNLDPDLNPDDLDRQIAIDSLGEKAISDGYFTITGEDFLGDEELKYEARMAYYDWCKSNNQTTITYDDEEGHVSASYDKPLTPAATTQLRDLAAEFDHEIHGDPQGQLHHFQIDLFQGAHTYSFIPRTELEFVGQLAAILT